MIEYFELKIYKGYKVNDEPDYEAYGSGEQWKEHIRLRFPGFDETIFLSLEHFWHQTLNQQLTEHTEAVEGYESIVKFGGVHQLKEPFIAVVKVRYDSLGVT